MDRPWSRPCLLAALVGLVLLGTLGALRRRAQRDVRPRPTVSGAPSVPPVFHLAYATAREVPVAVVERLLEMHPGFRCNVSGDAECEAFLLAHWSARHRDFFRSIPAGPIKCDFWRACAIHTFGGVYVDVDVELTVPLTSFVQPGVALCTSGSATAGMVNPILIVARPRHAILERCVEMMLGLAGRPFDYWEFSICRHLRRALDEAIPAYRHNESALYDAPGGVCQMLREEPYAVYTQAHTTWLGRPVMWNHSPALYDTQRHRFVTEGATRSEG